MLLVNVLNRHIHIDIPISIHLLDMKVLKELCEWLDSYEETWSNPVLPPQYRKSLAISYMSELLISKSHEPIYAYTLGILSRYMSDIRYEGIQDEGRLIDNAILPYSLVCN